MSELSAILAAAAGLEERGEPYALATVVTVRGSSYRRPGARLLVPAEGAPVGVISGGCLEKEAARLAREALRLDAPVLVTVDHSAEGDELWGTGLGCRGVIDLLAEPPVLAAETLDALRAGLEGRASYLLTALDGARSNLTALEAAALGEGAAMAVAQGRPTLIRNSVLDPILPPLQLVVCGAGPDAGPLVAAGLRLGWRVSVFDPRRSLLSGDRFLGAQVYAHDPARAAEMVDAREWTAVVLMSHDYLRDAAFLGSFIGREVLYLGVLGPRNRTDRLLAELDHHLGESDRAALHSPAGLDIGADGPEEVATAIVGEILAVVRGRSGRPLRERPGPIHG